MTKLSSQECIPCDKQEKPLTKQQAEEYLNEINDWVLADDATYISREFIFKNFRQAQEFVNKVGEVAESQKHHPDITFGWGYASIKIQTHNINGLHKNDFILAGKIDFILS
jgi:4a-hydroxytetrahydrobiopterin dehydratase